MSSLDWGPILEPSSPTEQVEMLEKTLETKLNLVFPLKTVKTSSDDLPFFTAELKVLDRRIKRIYNKSGKTEKYDKLKIKYDMKLKKAGTKYIEKNVTSLMNDNPGKAYSTLKKMGAQPGDCSDEGSFSLQNHLEANLTTEQCTEEIANHFSRISQEFPPLNIATLPPHVQNKLNQPTNLSDIPQITVDAVREKIKMSKKSKSVVPGDLPKKLIQECASDISIPVSKIFQNILTSCEWPKQWRVEYGVPLQKVPNPATEDQLRIISLTSYLSKVGEGFVIDWLMKYVGDKIDWGQYGGLKGNSITHYLIELTNFILYNQDLSNPRAVLAMMIDFSKAFNPQQHNTLIRILSDMEVPSWLLKIVMAYLTDRELILRYKGKSSGRKSLPGGTPQGTRLGMFLFLILINFAGFTTTELEHNIGSVITKPLNERKPIKNSHMKYIDDMTYATSLQLKKCLKVNTDTMTQPLTYHDRTGHYLPESESEIHKQVVKLKAFVEENHMRINQEKSKVMIFNTLRKFDFMPKISIDDENYLEVVEEMRLLVIIFQSNMKWYSNTLNLCQRGYSRLWMLRNLKKYGASRKQLLDVYIKQCRCVMELAVPVWSPGLSKTESFQLERVQKSAFSIILGQKYHSYDVALGELNMESLASRRVVICLEFAKKSQKHEKFQTWFKISEQPSPTFFEPIECRTDRYRSSPLPYLTNLMNDAM